MKFRSAMALFFWAIAATANAQDVPPPLEAETLTVEAAIADGPNLFAIDSSWNGASSIFILGFDDLAMKGNLNPGLQATMVLSKDGSTLYTASNYNTRIVYGATTSIVHEFDVKTASIRREIEVPAKLAMTKVQPGLIALTSDEAYLLLMNATPATSVTVVDLAAGKVLAEIPTPGCWLIQPAVSGYKFTTVCGDGTLASYTWRPDGSFGEPTRSAVMFDPIGDALFPNPVRMADSLVYASYKGNLLVVDDSGAAPLLTEKVALTEGIEGTWAPGGSEVIAGHVASNTVYLLMHPDAQEGSHKDSSTEIWAYDMTGKSLLGRSPSNGETTLVVAQADPPTLLASDEETVFVYDVDAGAGRATSLVRSAEGLGEIVLLLTDQ